MWIQDEFVIPLYLRSSGVGCGEVDGITIVQRPLPLIILLILSSFGNIVQVLVVIVVIFVVVVITSLEHSFIFRLE
jgi:hypothetical protein